MTDRELLKLAAKAVGLKYSDLQWSEYESDLVPWDPINDDGDALRLAVMCKLTITYVANETWPDVIAITGHQITEQVGTDPFAATRRAIVRAAAEIGRSAS